MSAQPANPNVPPDHVTIEIDGQSMVVPKSSMIISAADKAGIPIPRFCYHDKLGIAANCRMCLVEVEKMPKPAPACATPVPLRPSARSGGASLRRLWHRPTAIRTARALHPW